MSVSRRWPDVTGFMYDRFGYAISGALHSDEPGYFAFIEYRGDNPATASQLPEMEARGPFHPLGAGVGGKVPLSELTDYTETQIDIPVPGRVGEKP